jgi:hypothetical protein
MPELLGFKEQKAVTDYHLLLMKKETITTRITEEMFCKYGVLQLEWNYYK